MYLRQTDRDNGIEVRKIPKSPTGLARPPLRRGLLPLLVAAAVLVVGGLLLWAGGLLTSMVSSAPVPAVVIGRGAPSSDAGRTPTSATSATTTVTTSGPVTSVTSPTTAAVSASGWAAPHNNTRTPENPAGKGRGVLPAGQNAREHEEPEHGSPDAGRRTQGGGR